MENLSLNFSHAGLFHSSQTTTNHIHAGSELVYVASGKCRTDFPGLSLEAGPGQIYIISPDTPHIQYNEGVVETLYVVFGIGPRFLDSHTRVIDLHGDELTESWLRQMIDLCSESHFEQCEGLLVAVLQRIKEIERVSGQLQGLPPKMTTVLRFISDNLLEPNLSLEMIAKAAHLSPSSLKSQFQKELHISPMKHVQKLKIERGRQLLRNPYLNVGEVAQACGYPDQNYFSRIFRKVTGKTPSEFRHEMFMENRTMPEEIL